MKILPIWESNKIRSQSDSYHENMAYDNTCENHTLPESTRLYNPGFYLRVYLNWKLLKVTEMAKKWQIPYHHSINLLIHDRYVLNHYC